MHYAKGEQSTEQMDEMQASEDMSERMSGFVSRLTSEADRRVKLRLPVEQRWKADLRQYYGVYDPETQRKMDAQDGSKVFLNLTRTKTNAMMARLWDLLFPTDDRNWGIQPTPVPELATQAEETTSIADDAEDTFAAKEKELRQTERQGREDQANQIAAEMAQVDEVRSVAKEAADRQHEILNEAKSRCTLMEVEILDQLKAAKYQAQCRDMLEDACKIGTGVLKGPVLNDRTKPRWAKREQDGNVIHILQDTQDNRPAAIRVDPWSFFPDPDARTVEDCEGFYERHLMTKAKLRKFARRPDVDKDAIRGILKSGPGKGDAPTHLADLHNITGQKTESPKDLFVVWEYTGPIDWEDMEVLAEAFEDEDMLTEMGEADPLTEFAGKVWFCNGKVLSFALHPLDSNAPIYSVFQLERDETSLFGFGIPHLMSDPQSILNAALRMMMDNAALGTGPQIVINTKVVTPQNGEYTLTGRKIWLRNGADVDPNQRPFETFDINMHQPELANMMQIAREIGDEVTAMPQIAQGEQGTGVTKTAQGMALLMNSANVVFRRVVKNFDDDVTVPMIGRFYDWNMQFSDKDEIKGDYEVDARGSSVLLVREMQANNLMMIAQMFGDHPIFSKMLKHNELLRQIFRAHMIPADEITKTEREIERAQSEGPDPATQALVEQQQLANELKQAEIELKREEMDLKQSMHNREWDARDRISEREYSAAMGIEVERLNQRGESDSVKAAMKQAEIDHKERSLAAEAAMAQRTGQSAGGSI